MSADRKVEFGFTPIGEALNDLPQDLREWLDGHSPVLTLRVSKFIIGELISGDNVWTAEKVEFEYAKKYRGGFCDQALSSSVISCLDGMAKRHLLKTPKGADLKNSSRNAKFRMKTDGAYLANAYIYMADLAEQAGVGAPVVEGIYWQAQYYLENM